MKRNLIIGFSLFLFLYCLCYGLYAIIQKKVSVNRQKEENFLQHFARSETWFLGDSHPLQAVLADSIPGAFNWASSSEYYLLSYFKIKALLKKGFRPKRLILPLEYHSFSAQGRTLWLGHELDDLFWKSKIDPEDLDGEPEYLRWYIQAQIAPFAGQFYKLSQIWNPKISEISKAGFQKDTGNWTENADSLSLLKARLNSHFGKFDLIDSVQILFLRKILNLAEKSGVEVIFIRYPLSKMYLESMKSISGIQDMEKTIHKNSLGHKVLDCRSLFENQQNYFSDPDHLNKKGALAFSLSLKKLIQ
jgi:hypothetical protein